ncbi:12618_t:CDS:1, partial [Entrophospora sp. SA101]
MESAETLLQAKTPKIDHNQSQHTLNNGINNESNKSGGTYLEQGKVYKFPISPLTRFSGQCVTYKLPIEITCFSYDGERKLHHDDREL